jgi:hypothetical protein
MIYCPRMANSRLCRIAIRVFGGATDLTVRLDGSLLPDDSRGDLHMAGSLSAVQLNLSLEELWARSIALIGFPKLLKRGYEVHLAIRCPGRFRRAIAGIGSPTGVPPPGSAIKPIFDAADQYNAPETHCA